MSMTAILQNHEHGVLTMTINRVDKKNALTADMYASLADGLSQAAANKDVRVVLLQGHETVFSAGNDIADFLQQPNQDVADGNCLTKCHCRQVNQRPGPLCQQR